MARGMSQCRLLAITFILSIIGVRSTISAPLQDALDAILKLAKEFEGFKQQLSSMETRLLTLQAAIGQKSTSGDSRCWARNIAEAIRGRKYRLAEEGLIELNNDEVIPSIVHDVYEGSSTNVDKILNFARALKSADTKFIVFNALRDEMRSSGLDDPLKLILLANELQRLLRLSDVELKKKSQALIDDIVEEMITAVSSKFKTAMITNKFQNNDEVETLANALFDFRSDVSDCVMEEVVDKVFGVVSAESIIDNISSYKYIQQAITGLSAVFNRFNFAANLNNDAIIKLASSLRKLQMRANYGTLSQNLKDSVSELINRLPTCVSNLFFAKKVCLWNRGKQMYLHAADTSISYNTDRRNIFMYTGEPKSGANWIVDGNGTEVFFINTDYENEYLYPAGIIYDDDMRHVFTWIPGNNREPQSVWLIELDGDYCYLKSADYKEYLFASGIRYNDKNSYVMTSITGKGVKSSAEFQWQLRNCSHTTP